MLKVLMIDAGPSADSTTYIALNEIRQQLQAEGVDSEIFYVGNWNVESCKFCNACKSTGRCVLNDGLNTLLEKAETADAFVFASQSHYGVPNGNLFLLIHRFVTANPSCQGKPVATVVTCRRSGATSALSELNTIFSMKSMPLVTSSYWNLVVGSTPEKALQDEEGLRTMRNLGRNMAWMLKSIDFGKQNGIALPLLE